MEPRRGLVPSHFLQSNKHYSLWRTPTKPYTCLVRADVCVFSPTILPVDFFLTCCPTLSDSLHMAAPISHLQLIHSLKSCLRASTWHPPAHTHTLALNGTTHANTLSLLSLSAVFLGRASDADVPFSPVSLSASLSLLLCWVGDLTVKWRPQWDGHTDRRGGGVAVVDGWMDVGLLTQPSAATLSSPFALFRSLLWLQLSWPIQFPAHPVIRPPNHPPQSLLTMNLIHRGSHKEPCTSIHQYHYAACRVIFGHEEDINTQQVLHQTKPEKSQYTTLNHDKDFGCIFYF